MCTIAQMKILVYFRWQNDFSFISFTIMAKVTARTMMFLLHEAFELWQWTKNEGWAIKVGKSIHWFFFCFFPAGSCWRVKSGGWEMVASKSYWALCFVWVTTWSSDLYTRKSVLKNGSIPFSSRKEPWSIIQTVNFRPHLVLQIKQVQHLLWRSFLIRESEIPTTNYLIPAGTRRMMWAGEEFRLPKFGEKELSSDMADIIKVKHESTKTVVFSD